MDPLLRLLEENALATHETLAAQLDTTPADIKARIKQLEHDRVILAYKAIVDDERAKRTHVKAVIEVRITPEREGGFEVKLYGPEGVLFDVAEHPWTGAEALPAEMKEAAE